MADTFRRHYPLARSRPRVGAAERGQLPAGSDVDHGRGNPNRRVAPNCPHKLTKTAEPWLGGEPPLGGSNCTPASRRLQFAPATAFLVAAAAAPLPGGRHGGRLLQLRVSTLARRELACSITAYTALTFRGSLPYAAGSSGRARMIISVVVWRTTNSFASGTIDRASATTLVRDGGTAVDGDSIDTGAVAKSTADPSTFAFAVLLCLTSKYNAHAHPETMRT
jgi:hypothetical protein